MKTEGKISQFTSSVIAELRIKYRQHIDCSHGECFKIKEKNQENSNILITCFHRKSSYFG